MSKTIEEQATDVLKGLSWGMSLTREIIEEALQERDRIAREEERERCLQVLPQERIIHEYMESQNTGENRGWNDYRTEAILAITNKDKRSIYQWNDKIAELAKKVGDDLRANGY